MGRPRCLLCNFPKAMKVARQRRRRHRELPKEIFYLFCKLLGMPEKEIDTFADEYNVDNHSPFCDACVRYPLDLSKAEESQTRIEDEVLALQIEICKKLRKLSERKDEADEIVEKIRNKMSKGSTGVSGVPFRKRIIELTPLRTRESKIVTSAKANPIEIEGYPQNFVIPNNITKISVTKLKIKDEPIDYADDDDGAFDAMKDSIEDSTFHESSMLGDYKAGRACSYDEDSNDSIGINPLDANKSSDEDERDRGEILEQNDFEDVSEKLVSKLLTGSKRKQLVNTTDTLASDDDDCIQKRLRIMPLPKRRRAIVTKKTQKLVESDSEYSDSSDSEGNNRTDDKSDEDEEELHRQQRRAYKEPKDPRENQLELIKYLGEIEKSEDGKLTFRDIEVIERQVNKLECGQCGFISAEGGTYPNSILLVSVRMRKHVMEKHLGGYSCPLCLDRPPAQQFRTQIKHMRLKHSTGTGIECGICAKPYKYISAAYRFHLFTHKSKEEKEEAIRSGIKVPNYCPKNKKGDKIFKCKDCDKSYSFNALLKNHMKVHMDKEERDKERVPCYVCGKLKYPHLIKLHEKTHDKKGDKKPKPLPRHPCEFCDRRFRIPSHVALHVRQAHTGERLHPCQMCSKSFYTTFALKLHMKTHSTEREFSCPLCSAAYKSKHNLKRHQRTSHPDQMSAADDGI